MPLDGAPRSDKTLAAETVTRIFHALDDHDWPTIAALTTDPVDIDYPSKPGGAESISVEAFVSGLREFLPGFDATQHLLGPIVVDLRSDTEATARFHARVTHLLDDATDTPVWVIGCHYTFGLERHQGSWKLSSSRVRTLYEEGNQGLEALARQRVAAGSSSTPR